MALIGQSIAQAVATVKQGGILIYPTECVFGMGCDYNNETSVNRLLQLKQRPVEKGLILVASHIQQVLPLIQPSQRADLARALKTWPGHHTWVFPATKRVPQWITGQFDTLAVRISSHPTVKSLCDALGQPLVSTSANISGQASADSCQELSLIWRNDVDYYLSLPLGGKSKASSIRLASNGAQIR